MNLIRRRLALTGAALAGATLAGATRRRAGAGANARLGCADG